MSLTNSNNSCLEQQHIMELNNFNGNDFSNVLKTIAGGLVGAAGALAAWFNDIVNGDAEFSLPNCLMLLFVGATIGTIANIAAPMFNISDKYTVVFACAAASAHKYIFRYASRIIEKWISK